MRMEELADLVDSKKFSLYSDLSRGGQANIISRSDFRIYLKTCLQYKKKNYKEMEESFLYY